MNKHTPVPWYVVLDPETDKSQEHCGTYAIHHDSDVIADGLTLGDAQLIAAAPDMAEAIVFALADSSGMSDASCDRLRAALAKAGL